MIEELKSEKIVNKMGGKFKLTALVQRRMAELLQGGRPLIQDVENKTMLEIAIKEILQDKIAIDDGTPAEPSAGVRETGGSGGMLGWSSSVTRSTARSRPSAASRGFPRITSASSSPSRGP